MAVLIISCLLIILVMGAIWLYTNWVNTKYDIHESDYRDSGHLVEILDLYLDDITSNVEIVSTSPDTIVSLHDNNSSRLGEIMDNLEMSVPKPEAVYILDDRGNILYSTKKALKTTNLHGLEWYNLAVNATGPYITGLYYSDNLGDYAFGVLTPIRNNTTILGRIYAVFTPESLQESIREHNLDPRDNIIVVDSHGIVVSSNDLSIIGRNTNLSGYPPVQKVMRGESGFMEHYDSWDGQPRISAYQPVKYGNWGVIVSTPLAVEYKPLIDRIEWIMGVLAIFAILFLTFGYLASKYLTDPILDISITMKKISQGDYAQRVETRRKDEIGELAGTFNTMMDGLEEARSQSGMYLELMGHDINNINQVAIGYLELAEQQIASGKPLGTEDEKLIKKPIDVLRDSSNLIDNVIKLQQARVPKQATIIVDLCDVLAELASQYSHLPERELRISLNCAGPCHVFANELIRDVFSNLIWNAIKHSNPSKQLVISLSTEEAMSGGRRYFRTIIEDNGPGIRDELKGKLFSRFARGETKAKGSGLGLYLVKTLVEGYHGTVWAEDRVHGDYAQGSRFVVMLPAVGNGKELS